MLEQLTGLEARLADIGQEIRRQHYPLTLAEFVDWEREFGAEFDSKFPSRTERRSRVELCKMIAKRYELPYVTVKSALAPVWGSR
jgi:hypothetical protein